MAQTILLFRINRDKYAVIQNVCRTLGIRIIDVARKDYSQKLGRYRDLPERQKNMTVRNFQQKC